MTSAADEAAPSDVVSATVPDWERERRGGHYGVARRLLRSIRRYQAHRERGGWSWLVRKIAVLEHVACSMACASDIPLNSRLGGGLLLPHPLGIVIHPEAEIGPNCLIFQNVTIGAGPKPGLPRIGGHVDIGAGAAILGGVTIGDHAKIGANAVVVRDVPANATAVGVPARVL